MTALAKNIARLLAANAKAGKQPNCPYRLHLMSGASPASIGRILDGGRYRDDTLAKLATALGVTPAELLAE